MTFCEGSLSTRVRDAVALRNAAEPAVSVVDKIKKKPAVMYAVLLAAILTFLATILPLIQWIGGLTKTK